MMMKVSKPLASKSNKYMIIVSRSNLSRRNTRLSATSFLMQKQQHNIDTKSTDDLDKPRTIPIDTDHYEMMQDMTTSHFIQEDIPSIIEIRHVNAASTAVSTRTTSSALPKLTMIQCLYHGFVAMAQLVINYVYDSCCGGRSGSGCSSGINEITSGTVRQSIEGQSTFQINKGSNESIEMHDAKQDFRREWDRLHGMIKNKKSKCGMDPTIDCYYRYYTHGTTFNRYGKQDYTMAEEMLQQHFVHPNYQQ